MNPKNYICLVTAFLLVSCYNPDVNFDNAINENVDSANQKLQGMYTFAFVGQDSLRSFLNVADLNDIKYMYIFDDSIVIEGNWNLKNLEIFSLVSKNYIKLRGLDLPDSLRLLRFSFIDLFDNNVLDNTHIDHLLLRIEGSKIPDFIDRIGSVERLSLSGLISDKSILYRFKDLKYIDLNNSPIKDSLTNVDSLNLIMQE